MPKVQPLLLIRLYFDNVPVLDDNDGGGILEISIRCIDFGDEGLRYLGTWAKYTV